MKERPRISRRGFLEGLVLAGGIMLAPGGISQLATWITEQNLKEEREANEGLTKPGSVLFGGWYTEKKNPAGRWFDEQAQVITTFPEWESNDWGAEEAKRIVSLGKLPLVSLIPYQDSYFYLSSGQQKEFIKHKARNYEGVPAGIRLFIEANGEWYCYGNGRMSKERFLDGYRNAVEGFRQVDSQAAFVYSLDARRTLDDYYPGDEWVDVNGLDGYNRATTYLNLRMVEANVSFRNLFGPKIAQLRLRSNRPVAITEFSVDSYNPWAGQWFTQAIEMGPKLGVTAMLCFCENKENLFTGEANWDNLRGDRWRMVQQYIRENKAYYRDSTSAENLLNILRSV